MIEIIQRKAGETNRERKGSDDKKSPMLAEMMSSPESEDGSRGSPIAVQLNFDKLNAPTDARNQSNQAQQQQQHVYTVSNTNMTKQEPYHSERSRSSTNDDRLLEDDNILKEIRKPLQQNPSSRIQNVTVRRQNPTQPTLPQATQSTVPHLPDLRSLLTTTSAFSSSRDMSTSLTISRTPGNQSLATSIGNIPRFACLPTEHDTNRRAMFRRSVSSTSAAVSEYNRSESSKIGFPTKSASIDLPVSANGSSYEPQRTSNFQIPFHGASVYSGNFVSQRTSPFAVQNSVGTSFVSSWHRPNLSGAASNMIQHQRVPCVESYQQTRWPVTTHSSIPQEQSRREAIPEPSPLMSLLSNQSVVPNTTSATTTSAETTYSVDFMDIDINELKAVYIDGCDIEKPDDQILVNTTTSGSVSCFGQSTGHASVDSIGMVPATPQLPTVLEDLDFMDSEINN